MRKISATARDRLGQGMRRTAGSGMLVLLALAACQPPPVADPPVLRFGAIPDQAPARVEQQHRAVIERVCEAAKLSCQWVPSSSYEELVDRFGRSEIDVAYFGAVTFAQALHRHAAAPLVMRDVDFRFSSVVLVRKDHPAQSLEQLRGSSFGFGNRSSTSGHYMLRQRLGDAHIVPEDHFASVVYTGNHDATLRAVADGRIDAGGVNASVFVQRLVDGDPAAAQLRVLWRSRPYTDYAWAARAGLSPALRARLADAFLDLDLGAPRDAEALSREGAAGYVPAFASDFDEATAVLRAQGRL